jgi:hypothetical protein
MPTIDATIAGDSSNSYISLADADAYFATLLDGADWAAFTTDKRERALISATAVIERLQLRGKQYDRTTPQALHFPRATDYDAEGDCIIPPAIQNAQCEQALWMLQQQAEPELFDRAALRAQGVTSMSLDGLSESYGGAQHADGLSPTVRAMLRPYIATAAHIMPRGYNPHAC